MSADTPQFAGGQAFSCITQFADAIGWDLDFRQLSPGKLIARAEAIVGARNQLINFSLNQAFHQLGAAPANMITFGIPNHPAGDFKWCSESASEGALLNFNLPSGFQCISASGFEGITLTFDQAMLEEQARQMQISRPLSALIGETSVWKSPETVNLLARLRRLFGESLTDPVHLKANAEFVNEEMGMMLLDVISGGSARERQETAKYRSQVIRRAIEILENADDLPITVSELGRRVLASPSTLLRAFQSEFGVTPKTYIRNRCLSAVRDELTDAPPGTLVTDVANRWGFWHMGQFAHDFYALFGELPSDSKRHARKPNQCSGSRLRLLSHAR